MTGRFWRAMPSEASLRSFFNRRASSTDGTTTSAGYTRSARPHSRSRPTRPAIATSPRIVRHSSIWVTLRFAVHPVEAHGTTHVSGMSREAIGPPELPSSSRMSRRKGSLSRIHARVRNMSAEWNLRFEAVGVRLGDLVEAAFTGRMAPRNAYCDPDSGGNVYRTIKVGNLTGAGL